MSKLKYVFGRLEKVYFYWRVIVIMFFISLSSINSFCAQGLLSSTHIHLKNLQESIWVRLKRFVLDIIHPMFFALFYNFHWTCFTSKNLVTSWNCTWVQVWRGYLQAMTPNAFFFGRISVSMRIEYQRCAAQNCYAR